MRTMQDKITETIRRYIEDRAGLELVKASGGAANVGRLHVMTGLSTIATISYDFQGDYCTLTLAGPAAGAATDAQWRAPGHQVTRGYDGQRAFTWHALKYTDGDRLAGFMALLRDLLAPYKIPAAATGPAEAGPAPGAARWDVTRGLMTVTAPTAEDAAAQAQATWDEEADADPEPDPNPWYEVRPAGGPGPWRRTYPAGYGPAGYRPGQMSDLAAGG